MLILSGGYDRNQGNFYFNHSTVLSKDATIFSLAYAMLRLILYNKTFGICAQMKNKVICKNDQIAKLCIQSNQQLTAIVNIQ